MSEVPGPERQAAKPEPSEASQRRAVPHKRRTLESDQRLRRCGARPYHTWFLGEELAQGRRRSPTVDARAATTATSIVTFCPPSSVDGLPTSITLTFGHGSAEAVRRGLAPATVVKAAQIMGKIMAVAVQDGRLAASPCTGLRLPHIERREMRFLTPGEVAVLAEVIDPRYRALVYLGGYGGLRIGEIFGLHSTRVDLFRARRGCGHACRSLRQPSLWASEDPRRTANSATPPRPVSALDQHLREFGSPDGLVFTAPAGGPVRLASWRRRFWLPATKAAGVAPLRPHDLRHTAVALWIAAGATPKEIATRAGHSSVVKTNGPQRSLVPGARARPRDRTLGGCLPASTGTRSGIPAALMALVPRRGSIHVHEIGKWMNQECPESSVTLRQRMSTASMSTDVDGFVTASRGQILSRCSGIR